MCAKRTLSVTKLIAEMLKEDNRLSPGMQIKYKALLGNVSKFAKLHFRFFISVQMLTLKTVVTISHLEPVQLAGTETDPKC